MCNATTVDEPPPAPLLVTHVPAAAASSFVYVHSSHATDSLQVAHCLRGESFVTERLACTQAASACPLGRQTPYPDKPPPFTPRQPDCQGCGEGG